MQPPLPPEPVQAQSSSDDYWQPQIPPISGLLIQESNAWAALLNLHGGVSQSARELSEAVTSGDTVIESSREAIQLKEAGFFSALTQLAAHADALSEQALRLRALRKARAATDVQAFETLLQAHTVEALQMGTQLATTSSTDVNSVTAELRQAGQATRTQIAQVRGLLGVVQAMPSGTTKKLSICVEEDGNRQFFSTDKVFEAIFEVGTELNETTLIAAIERLSTGETATETVPTQRVAVRRNHSAR